jgi:hypothetical protein
MPLYYFDIRRGDGQVPDDEGTDLPDLCAAQCEALNSLADITRDAALERIFQPMSIEVLDEHRKVVFLARVDFQKV